MTEAIVFDRLAYIDSLKRSGISDEHARAHAEALHDALRDGTATTRDVTELRNAIDRCRTHLESKIAI